MVGPGGEGHLRGLPIPGRIDMGESRTIAVGRDGLVAVVDEEDYPLVSEYVWYVERRSRSTYARRKWTEDGRVRSQYMHNFILGMLGVDHRNHDGLDNRRANLRPANQSQNIGNQRAQSGSSRFKGVHWFKRDQKWRACIKVGRRGRHIGYFASEEDAARAYDAVALKEFGEFAFLNFPAEPS
jgi:hypothetical protein